MTVFLQKFNIKQFVLLLILITSFLSGLLVAGYEFNQFSQLAKQRYGNDAFQRVSELNELLLQLANAPELEKLNKINIFFNQKIQYGRDIFIYNVEDYWATPLETIGRGAGDCEDFTIAKYVFLKFLKVPNEKLRLTYVKVDSPLQGSQGHMVLSYYPTPNSEPLILDNFNSFLVPASKRDNLFPIFSFNDQGLWNGVSSQSAGSATNRLSKWRDLLVRNRQDGLE